uniref:Uncharacterized protein n=1 Tax=Rhizophora mucronata TaxID=61149 RepID=A0A2P2N5E9_RHIMU
MTWAHLDPFLDKMDCRQNKERFIGVTVFCC